MKKFGLVVLVISILFGIVGVVGAQGVEHGQRGPDGRGRGGPMPERVREPLGELVEIVADEVDLTVEEVVNQVREGATLAEIIEANDGSVEIVTSNVMSALTERIETAVTEERLTRERADEMLANLEQHVTDALNGDLRPERPGFDDRGRRIVIGVAEEVATATGLTLEDIRSQVEAGATLETILTDNGVDLETFTADIIAKATELANERVAAGEVTQDQADTFIAEFVERLPELLAREFEAPRGRRGSI